MSLRSAWRAVTGRKTRRYNQLSDIDQSISKLDPDDISKQILTDPNLTPMRGQKLNVLLKIRDEAKKQGKKGLHLKKELDSLARKQMEAKREEDAEVNRMMEQINDKLESDRLAELSVLLPNVPRHKIVQTKSASKSRSAGGKRKTHKKSRKNKRR
jgi:hypothetical protein